MQGQIEHQKVKFPENRAINAQLENGDSFKIAAITGLSNKHINNVLLGFRRMTDEISDAVIKILVERNRRNETLKQLTNQ